MPCSGWRRTPQTGCWLQLCWWWSALPACEGQPSFPMVNGKLNLHPQSCVQDDHKDHNKSVRESNLQEHAYSIAGTQHEFLWKQYLSDTNCCGTMRLCRPLTINLKSSAECQCWPAQSFEWTEHKKGSLVATGPLFPRCCRAHKGLRAPGEYQTWQFSMNALAWVVNLLSTPYYRVHVICLKNVKSLDNIECKAGNYHWMQGWCLHPNQWTGETPC